MKSSDFDRYKDSVRNAREKWGNESSRSVLNAHMNEAAECLSFQDRIRAVDELNQESRG